jgi:N-acetylmuramoyl-L-alanine amidase
LTAQSWKRYPEGILSWINRSIAAIGSVVAALGLLALPARADAPLRAVYRGQTIAFSHVVTTRGATAIGVEDSGFQTLLRATSAQLTWRPGERYILIATPVPSVVSFAIGDRRYDVGPIALQASFAPFLRGNEAYLPLNEVLGSLDLAMRQDGSVNVIQPQLAAFDVRQAGTSVVLLAHAGAPIRPRVVRQSGDSITYAFDGVGTALTGTKTIGVGGVKSLDIRSSGPVRTPTTQVTIALAPGTTVQPARNDGDRDVTLSFAGPVAVTQTAGLSSPTPEPVAVSTTGPALVTGVSVAPGDDGTTVAIAVSGDAAYQWHRLRAPDNRFWVDIENAALQGAPSDQNESSPLVSMRVRQIGPSTVRVALSLEGQQSITFLPSTDGLTVQIGADEVSDGPRSGSGSVGSVVSVAQQNAAPVTPAPEDGANSTASDSQNSAWKFGPRSSYVASNPRLIVIDPGHGGSDQGSQHGGLSEAFLNLDTAKRLRDLLVARGWQVKLTRESDVDVFAPNDSARDELQARVNVANNAGARLFVSIHANAFINSGPYGTTCYISKPDDVALARIIEMHLAADGTKDDGVVKSHLYVTLHTKMPAVLIETAFLTNPNDLALLGSPAWRQKVAQEIADGIGEYARRYPVQNQPPQ